MRHLTIAILCSALIGGGPALAGPVPAGPADAPGATASPAATREPTPGQLAARERMRKCGMEWRQAKEAKTTDGMKWPQYWKACNARMKGQQV